jgi:hypothetical protein
MVYIFKTNVTTRVAVNKLAQALDKVSFITKWNFDLQDCDNILRIEAHEFDTKIVCGLLNSLGYSCVELF